jgi:anti-sigma regulatory factor (Ser/Thr protein kinase)
VDRRKRQIDALFDGGGTLQAGEVARTLGVTRQTAHRYLRQLVDDGRLSVEGAGRGTRYRRPAEVAERRCATAGLEEDRVWRDLSAPGSILGSLPDRAQTTLQYALTELVNNAIEHSGAPEVAVRISAEGGCVTLVVEDQGVGIFEHIRARMGLQSHLEALQELSKGKTTTMPSRHTGEGIFFTSKAVHEFEIRSETLRWLVDNRRHDMAVGGLDPPVAGTEARVELDTDQVRDLSEVFAEYTEESEFSRTRAVIRLFAIGTKFVSRSEAKRLLRGLDRFREVVVDFKGVELVGQGFADEVFRVWALAHPETALIPTDMNEAVAFMIERAVARSQAAGET